MVVVVVVVVITRTRSTGPPYVASAPAFAFQDRLPEPFGAGDAIPGQPEDLAGLSECVFHLPLPNVYVRDQGLVGLRGAGVGLVGLEGHAELHRGAQERNRPTLVRVRRRCGGGH